jgi:hypothetical protein
MSSSFSVCHPLYVSQAGERGAEGPRERERERKGRKKQVNEDGRDR